MDNGRRYAKRPLSVGFVYSRGSATRNVSPVIARLIGVVALVYAASAQDPVPQDPPILFRERVNLVTVPVTVRDRQGRSVGSLKREDFQLFDNGRIQVISRFSAERSSSSVPAVETAETRESLPAAARAPAPERFVAYVFDDVHTSFADLARVRDAAWVHMQESLLDRDRAAIYTTSGQTMLEFTDDHDALHKTLFALSPHPRFPPAGIECPDVSHYQAELIVNRSDPTALALAVQETMGCMGLRDPRAAEGFARTAAIQRLAQGNQGTQAALETILQVVKRMTAAPGQRVIVLASQGFVVSIDNQTRNDIVDIAVKANVTINGLDARGLYGNGLFDASKSASALGNMQKAQMELEAQRTSTDIVAELAEGTGGLFFQNSNDLVGGFRKLAGVPEHVYLLGFSPDNLRMDGSFHFLKVKVNGGGALKARARRGYYAPKQAADPREVERTELRQALFSREEQRAFPVEVVAEPSVSGEGKLQLTIRTRIHVKSLRYREEGGMHKNAVTLVYGIFDRNGTLVGGETETIELNLKPATWALQEPVMQARRTFPIQAGRYSVRVLAQDAEERRLTALNTSTEIR